VRCQIDIAQTDMGEVVGGRTRSSDACHATPRDGTRLSVTLCTMTAGSRTSV
jgi:hypothetical protein